MDLRLRDCTTRSFIHKLYLFSVPGVDQCSIYFIHKLYLSQVLAGWSSIRFIHKLYLFSVPGIVYSWGDGDYGKLGRGGSDGCKTPKVVKKLEGQDVIKVCCGAQFSLALTKAGAVYTW